MKTTENLTIIGTSHIAPESVKQVVNTLKDQGPDIVALELDRQRLFGLLHDKQPDLGFRHIVSRVGFKGYVIMKLGAFVQKKLGKYTGVVPGAEMKVAFRIAQEQGSRVALIDQSVEITLKRLSKQLTFKEIMRFGWELVKGIFRPQLVPFDLRTLPPKQLMKRLINEMKTNFPSVYRVLVHERDVYMAKKLVSIQEQFPDQSIVAVIGFGHEDAVFRYVQKSIS